MSYRPRLAASVGRRPRNRVRAVAAAGEKTKEVLEVCYGQRLLLPNLDAGKVVVRRDLVVILAGLT